MSKSMSLSMKGLCLPLPATPPRSSRFHFFAVGRQSVGSFRSQPRFLSYDYTNYHTSNMYVLTDEIHHPPKKSLLGMKKMYRRHPRSPNFSSDEKILLLSIISRYNEIIEGRRECTGAMKGPIWVQVTKEYNNRTPTGVKRDLIQLKIAYKNMKKLTRQRAATGPFEFGECDGEKQVFEMVCEIIGINPESVVSNNSCERGQVQTA